jgi:acetolactate synthase-1/2/3 large subunit
VRVADYLVDELSKKVGHVFTVAGGGAIFLGDAMAKRGLQVPMHHEQACTMAAEAYGRIKGFGASVVTSGPGGTNAITGVWGAMTDCVPTITISGQGFKDHIKSGVQTIDIVSGVKNWTKYAVMVTEPESIRFHMERGLHEATSGRPGPVWLDIPADIQNAQIEPEKLQGFDAPAIEYEKDFSELVALLKASKRPLLHVGHGVRLGGAIPGLIRFLTSRIPVVTARNGNDIVASDHPSYVGRPGTFAQRGANFAVQTCDLYIAVGTRLCLAQTGYNARDYARNAKIVQVDIDRDELDKGTVRVDLKYHAQAKDLFAALNKERWPNWSGWLARCKERSKKYPPVRPEHRTGSRVNSYHLAECLSENLGMGEVIVTDVGYAFQTMHQAFSVDWGQRFLSNGGTAAMGWGLPAAIGASLASGQRVTCVSGDGGLMMNLQELATLSRLKLDVKLFVLNNDGYLTMRGSQDHAFGERMGSEVSSLGFPDFAKLAHAFGLPYLRISSPEEVNSVMQGVFKISGPVFIEVMADPDQKLEQRSVNKRIDGRIVQTPIEDSWPYLPKEEIEENLCVL